MKPLLAIWAASLRSSYRTRLADPQLRLAMVLYALIAIISGSWGAIHLTEQLHIWQQLGSEALSRGLWLYCLGTWAGLGTFALLSLRQAFATDEALLFYTLPISAGNRFRALLGSFFLEQLLSLALLQAVVMLYVFTSALGWQGLSWFLLLQLGVLVLLCGLLLAALLLIGYLLNSEQSRRGALAMLLLSLLLLSGLLLLVFRLRLTAQWWRPEIVLMLFAILLVLFLGPWASPLGRLYLRAFRTIQGWDRGQRTFTLPGLSLLTSLLAQRRTLTAAFCVRELQNQSRNPFFWFRSLLVWLTAFFAVPLARPFLGHIGLSTPQLVIAGASILTLLHILEPGVCAISGEGNRFALYLTAPYSYTQILQARLLSCLLPLLLEALAITLYISWQLQIGWLTLGPVLLGVLLLVTGPTTLLILGSAWDLNLNEAVEGAMQALMMEEVPLSPRRMLVTLLGVGSMGGMFLLFYWLPLMIALLLVLVSTVLLMGGTWKLSGKMVLQG